MAKKVKEVPRDESLPQPDFDEIKCTNRKCGALHQIPKTRIGGRQTLAQMEDPNVTEPDPLQIVCGECGHQFPYKPKNPRAKKATA